MIKVKIKTFLAIVGVITCAVTAAVFLFGDKFINMKPHSPGSAELDPLVKGAVALNVPDEPYTYNGSGAFNPLEGVTASDADGTDLTNTVSYSVTESSSYTKKELVYSVTGRSLRTTTATRLLQLSNYSGPTITVTTETIQCDISQISTLADMIFNESYVTAEDGFGNDISQSITVANRNDIIQSGTYTVTVTAENFLHDKVTANVSVEVVGELHENPIVLADDTATIEVGETFNPSSYILSAVDPDYGDMTQYIEISTNLNNEVPGEYYMNLFINGFDGVTTSPVTLYITVRDPEA